MIIREAGMNDMGRVAPLVMMFRDTLRGLKGTPPRTDLTKAEEEWTEFCRSGFAAYVACDGDLCAGFLVCRIDVPTV